MLSITFQDHVISTFYQAILAIAISRDDSSDIAGRYQGRCSTTTAYDLGGFAFLDSSKAVIGAGTGIRVGSVHAISLQCGIIALCGYFNAAGNVLRFQGANHDLLELKLSVQHHLFLLHLFLIKIFRKGSGQLSDLTNGRKKPYSGSYCKVS